MRHAVRAVFTCTWMLKMVRGHAPWSALFFLRAILYLMKWMCRELQLTDSASSAAFSAWKQSHDCCALVVNQLFIGKADVIKVVEREVTRSSVAMQLCEVRVVGVSTCVQAETGVVPVQGITKAFALKKKIFPAVIKEIVVRQESTSKNSNLKTLASLFPE